MTATTMARPVHQVKPRTRKPRKKPLRLVKLALTPTADGGPGVLDVTVGKDFASYCLTAIPADFGQAFHLEKFPAMGGEEYDVLLSPAGHSCECKGFLKHSHCKHIDCLVELRKRGKLPYATRRHDAPGSTQPAADAQPDADGERAPAAFRCNSCADHGYQPTANGNLETCPVCPPASRKPAFRSLGDAMRNAPEAFADGRDPADMDAF